jgi:hypothetical protein
VRTATQGNAPAAVANASVKAAETTILTLSGD